MSAEIIRLFLFIASSYNVWYFTIVIITTRIVDINSVMVVTGRGLSPLATAAAPTPEACQNDEQQNKTNQTEKTNRDDTIRGKLAGTFVKIVNVTRLEEGDTLTFVHIRTAVERAPRRGIVKSSVERKNKQE
jgi:hypothetical protein